MKKINPTKINVKRNFFDIWDNEIIEFLKENEITENTAKMYIAELKLYQNNKSKYELKVIDDIISLEEKQKNINPGLEYLDQIYFSENKVLSDLDYENNQTKLKIVVDFLKENKNGMYLCSNNGIGKTTLLVALANHKYIQEHEKTLFVFWPDFIEKTKRFSDHNIAYINKVKHARRLIIDDLGQESLTIWSRDDILHPIISYRLEKKLPTYISSNYTLKELEGLYTFRTIESKKTKSIIEKLSTLSKPYMITGENLRRKNG